MRRVGVIKLFGFNNSDLVHDIMPYTVTALIMLEVISDDLLTGAQHLQKEATCIMGPRSKQGPIIRCAIVA